MQKKDTGGGAGYPQGGAGSGDYGYRAADFAVPALFGRSDRGTVSGTAAPAPGVHLCHVRKGGIFPASGGEPAESGDRAVVYELFP